MIWPPPRVPYFYSEGCFLEAIMGVAGSYRHFFGHTREIAIRASSSQRFQLHMVADLDLTDPRFSIPDGGLTRLPLLHPFRHDGGRLAYRVLSNDDIEILRIDGTLTDGWPYPNYPDRFTAISFDLTDPIPCSREEFDEPMFQGVSPENYGEFITVVPDDRDRTPGLWQEDGNALVNAVFCFDCKTGVVETYNECD